MYQAWNRKTLEANFDEDAMQRSSKLILRDGELSYDTLIVATGSSHHLRQFGADGLAVGTGLNGFS